MKTFLPLGPSAPLSLACATPVSLSPLSPHSSPSVAEATVLPRTMPAPLCAFQQSTWASSLQDAGSEEVIHTGRGRKDAWGALGSFTTSTPCPLDQEAAASKGRVAEAPTFPPPPPPPPQEGPLS